MHDQPPTVIPAVNGEDNFLAQFDPEFKHGGLFAHITPSFVNENRGMSRYATSRMNVAALDVPEHFRFYDLFAGSSLVVSAFDCLSEHQVCALLHEHREWFAELGSTVYFPFTYCDKAYVAAVYPVEGGARFGMDVHRMTDPTIWPACGQKYIVKKP